MNIDKKQLRTLLLTVASLTAVICAIIAFFFRNHYFSGALVWVLNVLKPFLYGIVIAYLLWPLCLWLEKKLIALKAKVTGKPQEDKKHGVIRLVSILLSLAFMLTVIILLLLAVLPQLIESITTLAGRLPAAFDRFNNWVMTLDNGEVSHEAVVYAQQVVSTVIQKLQEYLQGNVLPNMEAVVTNVTSSFMNLLDFLKNFGLGCIVAAYLMGGWEKFHAQARLIVYGIFPRRGADWIRDEMHTVDDMFSGFVYGKLLDSLAVGLICFGFTTVANMPYAILVSVIIGVTNIIPFFGPYLGAIPSLLLITTISPVKGLIFLIFVIALQQFDGNFMGPHILGDKLGLSGIWILFSILVFSSIFGFVGMLIGVPVFGVIYDLFRRLILRCLRGRSRSDMIEAYVTDFCADPDEEKKQEKTKKAGKKKASKD